MSTGYMCRVLRDIKQEAPGGINLKILGENENTYFVQRGY